MSPDADYRLAQRVAQKLSGTPAMKNVEDVLEEMGETAANDRAFFQHLDRLIFMCAECEWWHDQSQNATPDGAKWVCRECIK